MIDDDPPIVCNIIPGTSSGHKFAKFWLKEACYSLRLGDTVILDNINFHVQGEWFEVVHHFLKELGVQYYSLPKYSPELNPAELVFSKLKGCLQGKH